MINQIILCIIGTISFAVTMKAPRESLIYVLAGSAITAATERILAQYYGDFIACFLAMLCLAFFSELAARKIKTPTTVILMPSAIPLLPGSSIYYTMLYAIQSDKKLFSHYAASTVLSGLGIALGAVIGSTIVKMINEYRTKD